MNEVFIKFRTNILNGDYFFYLYSSLLIEKTLLTIERLLNLV